MSWVTTSSFKLKIPEALIAEWKLKDGNYVLTDQLYKGKNKLSVKDGIGIISITIKPSESFIYKVENK